MGAYILFLFPPLPLLQLFFCYNIDCKDLALQYKTKFDMFCYLGSENVSDKIINVALHWQ
jgi:hypothetical protein